MKKNLLISILIFCLLIFIGFIIANKFEVENSFQKSKKMEVGEDITYVVKYLMFQIGEVQLKVLKEEVNGSDTIFSAIAYIDSYEGLPFVNLHQIYETKFDSKLAPVFFKGTVFSEDTSFTKYYFDKEKKSIYILKGKEKDEKTSIDSVADYDINTQDGLSLLYFARMNTGNKNSVELPCFINEKSERTRINFYDEVEDIEIDAVDYDIACIRLDGETDFNVIFGLTGDFEGWFSNDQSAVPILAKMHVLLGSITLELKSWKKKGWMPPKYKS
jgi:hypothetical protein